MVKTAEKGDRGVIFSKFGNEKLEKTKQFRVSLRRNRSTAKAAKAAKQQCSPTDQKLARQKLSQEDDVWSTTTWMPLTARRVLLNASPAKSETPQLSSEMLREEEQQARAKEEESVVGVHIREYIFVVWIVQIVRDGEDEDTVQKVTTRQNLEKRRGKISHQKYSKNTLTTTKTEAEENENENEAEKTKRQSIADVGKEKEREFRRQKVLERVQQSVAEILGAYSDCGR